MAELKRRFGIDAETTSGKTGEFKVIADGEKVAERGGNWLTRSFGGGYPDLNTVVEQIGSRLGKG